MVTSTERLAIRTNCPGHRSRQTRPGGRRRRHPRHPTTRREILSHGHQLQRRAAVLPAHSQADQNDIVLFRPRPTRRIPAHHVLPLRPRRRYLAGEGDDPAIVRPPTSTPTRRRADRRHRPPAPLVADRLTGRAAGIEPAPDDPAACPYSTTSSWCRRPRPRRQGVVGRPGPPGSPNACPASTPTGRPAVRRRKPDGLKSIQIKRTIDGKPLIRRGLARVAWPTPSTTTTATTPGRYIHRPRTPPTRAPARATLDGPARRDTSPTRAVAQ